MGSSWAEREATKISDENEEREGGSWDKEWLRVTLATALDEAHRAGERAMRERAAVLGDKCVAAYPEDVFEPPPPGEHGKTVDSCSAAMGRHLGAMFARQCRALPITGDDDGQAE